jgi:hypothetical protein
MPKYQLETVVPVDWLDTMVYQVSVTSLAVGTVLDSAPLVVAGLDPKTSASVKV